MPDEEVHIFINGLERPVGTYLYGRRMYDVMAEWETLGSDPAAISIGGPTLAAHAIRAGLVDEYQLFVAPVVVGSGLRFLPDNLRADLTLLDERPFANGMVYLRCGAG